MTTQDDRATKFSLEDIAQFLYGALPLDGVFFGENHPTEKGKYWWRKHLQAALAHERQLKPVLADDLIKEIRNINKIEQTSDMQLSITFASCRSAEAFRKAIVEPKKPANTIPAISNTVEAVATAMLKNDGTYGISWHKELDFYKTGKYQNIPLFTAPPQPSFVGFDWSSDYVAEKVKDALEAALLACDVKTHMSIPEFINGWDCAKSAIHHAIHALITDKKEG